MEVAFWISLSVVMGSIALLQLLDKYNQNQNKTFSTSNKKSSQIICSAYI